jgi:hypothetical protein
MANGEMTDVFIYDEIPQKLKVQIVHLVTRSIGEWEESRYPHGTSNSVINDIYENMHEILLDEFGFLEFPRTNTGNLKSAITSYFLNTSIFENQIDIIELFFMEINEAVRNGPYYANSNLAYLTPDDAIEQLNIRFKENGVGYQFEADANMLIRMDTTYVHANITKPTLLLLSNPLFENAQEEYLRAHVAYMEGRNKDCIVALHNAFESTMKLICHHNDWSLPPKATASTLIKTCLTNELVPLYLQNQLSSLNSLLESGATIRNNVAGHGPGVEAKQAEDELTRYALNLTGSNIVFLVELAKL